MNQPIHILNQMGVLTSFSIAKKVTEDDTRSYFSRQKKHGKNEHQIEEMLREKIVSEIQEAFQTNKIPGLISPQELAQNLGIDKNVVERIPELNRLIMVLIHKMAEKKYDKMSMCYFINGLVNMLGLIEEDFSKFHRQNNLNSEGNDDGEDDNDGED